MSSRSFLLTSTRYIDRRHTEEKYCFFVLDDANVGRKMNVSLGDEHSSVELSREDRVEASIESHVEWMSDGKEKTPVERRERLVSLLLLLSSLIPE